MELPSLAKYDWVPLIIIRYIHTHTKVVHYLNYTDNLSLPRLHERVWSETQEHVATQALYAIFTCPPRLTGTPYLSATRWTVSPSRMGSWMSGVFGLAFFHLGVFGDLGDLGDFGLLGRLHLLSLPLTSVSSISSSDPLSAKYFPRSPNM